MFDKVTSDIAHTKDVHWDFGFYCPHGLQLSIHPHPARCPLSEKLKKVEVCEDTIKVVCSTNGCKKTSIPLKDKQNCWFKHVDLVKKPAEKDCPQRDINTDSSLLGASAAPPTTQPQPLTPTESEPSDRDLMNNVASKIPSLWYSFGTQLDIPGGTLRAIRGNTDKDCFLEVFHIWKSSQSRLPISWSTVIDVLDSNSIAEYALASHLRSKYCVY